MSRIDESGDERRIVSEPEDGRPPAETVERGRVEAQERPPDDPSGFRNLVREAAVGAVREARVRARGVGGDIVQVADRAVGVAADLPGLQLRRDRGGEAVEAADRAVDDGMSEPADGMTDPGEQPDPGEGPNDPLLALREAQRKGRSAALRGLRRSVERPPGAGGERVVDLPSVGVARDPANAAFEAVTDVRPAEEFDEVSQQTADALAGVGETAVDSAVLGFQASSSAPAAVAADVTGSEPLSLERRLGLVGTAGAAGLAIAEPTPVGEALLLSGATAPALGGGAVGAIGADALLSTNDPARSFPRENPITGPSELPVRDPSAPAELPVSDQRPRVELPVSDQRPGAELPASDPSPPADIEVNDQQGGSEAPGVVRSGGVAPSEPAEPGDATGPSFPTGPSGPSGPTIDDVDDQLEPLEDDVARGNDPDAVEVVDENPAEGEAVGQVRRQDDGPAVVSEGNVERVADDGTGEFEPADVEQSIPEVEVVDERGAANTGNNAPSVRPSDVPTVEIVEPAEVEIEAEPQAADGGVANVVELDEPTATDAAAGFSGVTSDHVVPEEPAVSDAGPVFEPGTFDPAVNGGPSSGPKPRRRRDPDVEVEFDPVVEDVVDDDPAPFERRFVYDIDIPEGEFDVGSEFGLGELDLDVTLDE
jgi:hypothetical protein